ncbi:MAG: beta-galactosidase, partial [Bacteroides sp.]|nr:beta-galactosidase [Bacteroides sp.]
MKHPKQLLAVLLMAAACTMQAQRSEALLEKNWKFSKGDFKEASQPEFNDTKWESVVIPHDWAIFGPFDMNNDLQNVAVTQNFEKKASLKTGRTGGLPYVGTGWYRTSFDAPADKEVTLLFDGAMSEARVYINGKEACFWPFGYNSFHCNVTSLLNKDGKNNTLAVRLENRPQSSRWYPGAGLYRNVHLIVTDKIHVPVWGTQITTPHVNKDFAAVRLQTKIDNAGEKTAIRVETEILSPEGKVVTRKENTSRINHGQPFEQNFIVNAPELWSPESPSLYKAVSKIYADDKLVDTYTTRFGIRSIEYIADKGFYLNGEHRKFQGVCNHHDLGPLGAAINVAALRHQLTLLKDMGCDAIRTSHNMPTPELVALCDEMGFMMMIEPFDEWDIAKCENGYHRYFDEWAERDMINMLHNYRNNPCVVMWSIGNEVPTQCSPVGYKVAKFLQDICHREDPTRPVTCGMDQVTCVLANGFAAMIDIPGLNYRTQRYQESYDQLPQNLILGSETASTV